jgi:hypothetical protein
VAVISQKVTWLRYLGTVGPIGRRGPSADTWLLLFKAQAKILATQTRLKSRPYPVFIVILRQLIPR